MEAGSKSSFNQRTVPGPDFSFWLTWGYNSSFGMISSKFRTYQHWFITVVINHSPDKYNMSFTYKVSSFRMVSQVYFADIQHEVQRKGLSCRGGSHTNAFFRGKGTQWCDTHAFRFSWMLRKYRSTRTSPPLPPSVNNLILIS